MSVIQFNYQENAITFESKDGSVMMNATEMAKHFNKKPIHWLKLPSTIKFIDTLVKVRKSHFDNFVVTTHGDQS